jgi:TonB family protein
MSASPSSHDILARSARGGQRPCDRTLLGAPAIRTALGATLALAVVLTAVRLPWSPADRYLGWRLSSFPDRIELQQAPEEPLEKQAPAGGPITTFDVLPDEPVEAPPAEEEGNVPEAVLVEVEPASRKLDLSKLTQRPILEFADQSPQIVGGFGALYLNIHYPEAALRDNAQGRTIIEFVVEEDGTTSQIKVLKSLHPACDSVAVQAIRGTKFVPGRQNGELVRVKMRLPIRFKLTTLGRPESDTLGVGS